MNCKRKKILVFKLGLLGDVLMTTPFLRQLRRAYPDAEIQYWVGESYAIALANNPHLSSLHSFDGKMFFRRDLRKVYQLWRTLRNEQFHAGFFLGKHWVFNVFAWTLRIPRRLGFIRETISRLFLTDAVPYRDLRHEVYYYLDLLKLIAPVDYDDVRMEAAVPAEAAEEAAALAADVGLRDFGAVINSGGNNAGETRFVRRLPSQFFSRLVLALAKRQPVLLLGNAADRAYYGKFDFPGNVHNLAGTLPFTQSLALMKMARRIYSTDCGGLHMAGTVNDHVTAFFGPAHPERKAPFLSDLEVVWPDRERYNPRYDLFNTGLEGESFLDIQYSLHGETIDGSALTNDEVRE